MDVNITGSDDDQGIGVEVFDDSNNRHWVVVMWDGTVRGHETEDYPHEPSDRTYEEQKIMTQAEERARLAAHREFPEEGILDPPWIPEQLERAVDALRKMHVDEFAAEFEDCYRYITDPSSVEDVTEENAQMIFQPFLIDQSNTVVDVPKPVIQYYPPGSEHGEMTTHDPSFRERHQDPDLTKFAVVLPPLEISDGAYEFPDGFQIFLIEHFGGKIRDVYRHVGEEPPEPYDEVEALGHGLTADDPEYYSNHSP